MSVVQLIGKALLLLMGLVLLLGGGLCTFTNGYWIFEVLSNIRKSPYHTDSSIPWIIGLLIISIVTAWSGWKLLVWLNRSSRWTE